MATQFVSKTYDALCNMPQCMCDECDVYIFLRGGRTTSDGKPYIIAHVTAITQLSSGAVKVDMSYDDVSLPEEEGQPIDIIFGVDGTACDPDCKGDCNWLDKVLALLENTSGGGVQNRHYILFADDAPVQNGSFNLPRIPFTTGLKLSSVRITCFFYNGSTTAEFNLKVGATLKATFTGSLAQQRVLSIVPGQDLLLYDTMPVLEILNLDVAVYGQDALGLVVELIGTIGA